MYLCNDCVEMTYWKCWGFMAFIQTKYRKKSQMYKNMIRAELRDNLSVARSEFSIDILKQIAYMMCTKCILFLSPENRKALSTVSPVPRHTHKPLFFFSLHWIQQRLKYTFILKTLSHLKAYCLTYSSSSTKYEVSTNSKGGEAL